MSLVTNIILIHSVGEDSAESESGDEDSYPIQDQVNEYFIKQDRPFEALRRIDWKEIGGGKSFAPEVMMGTANYFHLNEFLEHLRGLKWKLPDEVQLLIKEEYADRFWLLSLADQIE